MSTARDLLLEIKRQMGKVNAAEPEETEGDDGQLEWK